LSAAPSWVSGHSIVVTAGFHTQPWRGMLANFAAMFTPVLRHDKTMKNFIGKRLWNHHFNAGEAKTGGRQECWPPVTGYGLSLARRY